MKEALALALALLLGIAIGIGSTRDADRICVAAFNAAHTRADTLQVVLDDGLCRHFIAEEGTP